MLPSMDGAAHYALSQPNSLYAYYGALLEDPNVQRGLSVIRHSEGTARARNPYGVEFGFRPFDDFSWHPGNYYPFTDQRGRKNKTSAAGAYQFLERTWNETARRVGIPDFSPRNQDIAALAKIDERGGLQSLLAGDLQGFVEAVGPEWASLPTAPSEYAQPTKSWNDIQMAWQMAGITNPPLPTSRQAGAFGALSDNLAAAGVMGLDGRVPAPSFSAPVMPVERGGALPPARDPATISPPRPDNFNYAGPPGLGGPGGTYLAGLPAQPAPGVLPGFEPSPMRPDNFAYQGPKGNFQVPGAVPPTTEAIPAMPYAPELPPSMTPPPARPSIPEVQLPDLAPPPMPNPRNGWNDAKRGGILGGVPGALAAPGIAQIGRNARTKAQGGNIGLFAGIPAAYRAAGAGFRGAMQNAFGSLPPPTPFSVGSGLSAIQALRGGAFGPGAVATSVSNPNASWSVNAYGIPEFESAHGFKGAVPDGF